MFLLVGYCEFPLPLPSLTDFFLSPGLAHRRCLTIYLFFLMKVVQVLLLASIIVASLSVQAGPPGPDSGLLASLLQSPSDNAICTNHRLLLSESHALTQIPSMYRKDIYSI